MISLKRNRIWVLKAMLVTQALLFNLMAQNIVYNGDFEIYDQCPTYGIGNNSQIPHATGWFVSGGTPDYWHECSNGVPMGQVGYQYDCCGGSGYAGMYVIVSINTPGDCIGREYMGTKLLDTLKAGHKYLVNMNVNRTNFDYSIASLGMLFTDTAIVLPNPQQGALLPVNPQVKSITPLTDTANWVLIQDTITAIGNEVYLTIGNFNTTATSDTLSSSGNWWFYGAAYYYIDGVSVYDVATLGINNIKNKKAEINVYPNPASSVLELIVDSEQFLSCSLRDLLGNEILSTKQQKIGVSNLPDGIYFLQARTTEGISTKKIIVQH